MFGFSNKPGAGITKEQAAKRNYFDIFGRHFGGIIGVSSLYTLSNLLFFIAALLIFRAYFTEENVVKILSNVMSGKNLIVPFAPFIPFVFIGPFTAGFTYVIRNYAKQEPTFLVSDFFEHSKTNFKQAIITSVLSAVVAYLLIQAFVFYNSIFITNNLPIGVLYTLFAIVIILFIITMFYVYPLMVTFKMNLKVILKNSWTFAILKLPQNLIIFLLLSSINIAILYVTLFVLYLPTFVYLALLAFFLTGFTSFTANYYIWHVMDKYIVSLVTPKKENESIFNDDEYPDFDDNYNEEVIPEDEYLL